MKRKVFLISLLAVFYICSFAANQTKAYVSHAVHELLGSGSDHRLTYDLEVIGVEKDNEEKFINSLIKWANENEFSIIQRDFDDVFMETHYYVLSKKSYYLNQIMETVSTSKNLTSEVLSTKFGRPKLFNPPDSNHFFIHPFDDTNKNNRNINGTYYIYSEGSITEKDLDQIIEIISEEFPMIQMYYMSGAFSQWRGMEITIDELMILIAIELVVFVFINSFIAKNTKKISILKLEGHSITSIWIKYVAKVYVLKFILVVFLCMVISTIYLPLNFLNSDVYYKPLLWYLLFYGCISVFFSFILLYLISCIKVSVAAKGKNNLKTYAKYLEATKAIVLLLSLFYIIPSIHFVSTAIRSSINEKPKLEVYENLFVIPTMKNVAYYVDEVFGQEDAVYHYLVNEVGLFTFSELHGYSIEDCRIFHVDQSYLEMVNLWDDYDTAVLFANYGNNEAEKVATMFGISHIIYIDMSNRANLDNQQFNSRTYYSNDVYIEKNSVLYYPGTDNYALTIINSSFYYSGTAEEAQAYIDNVQSEYGFESYVQVYSVRSLYDNYKELFFREHITDFIIGCILLGQYLLICHQLFITWLQSNIRKIHVKWSEGWNRYLIFLELFVSEFVYLCLLQLMVSFMYKINWLGAMLIVFIYFIIEMLSLLFLISRLNNSDIRRYL